MQRHGGPSGGGGGGSPGNGGSDSGGGGGARPKAFDLEEADPAPGQPYPPGFARTDSDAGGLLLAAAGGAQSAPAGATAGDAERRRRRRRAARLALAGALLAVSALAAAALAVGASAGRSAAAAASAAAGAAPRPVRRLAFGSCTAYDLRPQLVWTSGVIPFNPDAWVWLGDMFYGDNPDIDCAKASGPNYTHPQCDCPTTFMHHAPYQCFSGDVEHQRRRMEGQLGMPEYAAFVDFMCDGPGRGGAYPPNGADAAQCPRPIVGTWDDHDFGWNNGDKRHPRKVEAKAVFLDGLGDPQSSPRRGSATGLEAAYRWPSGSASPPPPLSPGDARSSPGDYIDLVLLDGRYDRDTLPCSTRREWCRQIMTQPGLGPSDFQWAWCRDMYVDGGPSGGGACCARDEQWAAWCAGAAAPAHPRWRELCDPSSSEFASAPAVLAADNITVLSTPAEIEAAWKGAQSSLWRRLVTGIESPLCEMVGARQRRWLRGAVAASGAPLLLVGSGSVVAGSVGHLEANKTSTCDGDDWSCYGRAQANLLHTLANATGCPVILTGDAHVSDIKVIMPGSPPGTNYSSQLQTARLAKPIWQVMASGMTSSTARSLGDPCEGTWLEDIVGLRPLGRCAYVPQPAFGGLEVDWARRRVQLSIRDAATGDVAIAMDGSRQAVAFDLDSCQRVE
ncbi:hypothetical protein Rsub_10050 [Raphidocelis subcapitata]|uniref:PhoD-like phosphatase metallophosphatase domain-containing protein n=1 Tax=Raphidocelis subcapitata TaxID=307507 RepID=A0A2V0PCC7_9CHLO|nr:hypothetical protein Rsub_10050 [Raphidocelis subcapitata]|eukprot:GBF97189.1 hypothetical protein Rsub_10050 [Raphidocelis subcapitata]